MFATYVCMKVMQIRSGTSTRTCTFMYKIPYKKNDPPPSRNMRNESQQRDTPRRAEMDTRTHTSPSRRQPNPRIMNNKRTHSLTHDADHSCQRDRAGHR